MKKRFVTMLLAVSVMASMGSSYAVFAEEAATEAADTKDDAAETEAADEKKRMQRKMLQMKRKMMLQTKRKQMVRKKA